MKHRIKLTIFVYSILSGPSAVASTYSWQFEGGRFVYARTVAELKVVRKLYSNYLVNVPNDDLDSVSITFSEWSLIGETKCAANDPRLHTETSTLNVCTREPGQPPTCQASETPLPTPPATDPCG